MWYGLCQKLFANYQQVICILDFVLDNQYNDIKLFYELLVKKIDIYQKLCKTDNTYLTITGATSTYNLILITHSINNHNKIININNI